MIKRTQTGGYNAVIFMLVAIILFLSFVIIGRERRKSIYGTFTPQENHYNVPQQNPYLVPTRYAVPVNISTNLDVSYKQVGILSNEDKIFPLYGRPLNYGRNLWQYYTMTDQFTRIKLPIYRGRRDCSDEHGCNELYDGDHVKVETFVGKHFRVKIYNDGNDKLRYI